MRCIMMIRVLAVATALRAAFAVHQYNTISQLQNERASAEERFATQARIMASESMEGQGAEIQRVMKWLNDSYQSSDGLRRPEGLWIDGHPDYEGLSVWLFDVYVRRRLQGDTEEQARTAIETAIKQSAEWKQKHASPLQ